MRGCGLFVGGVQWCDGKYTPGRGFLSRDHGDLFYIKLVGVFVAERFFGFAKTKKSFCHRGQNQKIVLPHLRLVDISRTPSGTFFLGAPYLGNG